MEIAYKVARERNDGRCDIWLYDTKAAANRKFRSLLNERIIKTIWAEIWETDYDIEGDEWQRIDGFERERVDIMGHMLLTERYCRY